MSAASFIGRAIVFVAFIGLVLGDLTCTTYLPHNWTTPYARLNVYDPGGDGVGAKPIYTIPANASATSPFSLANKKALGDTFYFKKCTSKSLGLKTTYYMSPSYCSASKRSLRPDLVARQNEDCSYLCYYNWSYFVQIIDKRTGNCLTSRTLNTTESKMDFKPCNPDPKDTSQIFGAERTEYYNNNYGIVEPVCDWEPQLYIHPVPQGTQYNYIGFDVAPDNKTLVRTSSSPRNTLMNAIAIDPLTTYEKK